MLFAMVTVAMLWYHVISKIVKIYLILGISILGAAIALHIALSVYRNIVRGSFAGRAEIQQLSDDALQVSLKVRRPWKFEAGQYIYLCVPGVSFCAWFQYHPFAVSWWHRDENGDTEVVFLIQPRKGFTRNLKRYAGSSLRAFIEGPYGIEKDLGAYGNVVLFATGIGIAGHLPYIRRLLEGHNNREVKTGRISLFWQIDKECDEGWVNKWMKELLKLDEHYVYIGLIILLDR